MAIKVKHEGNTTSRFVAAKAGGRAKRQAQDALKLAEMEAQQSRADADRNARLYQQQIQTAATMSRMGGGVGRGISAPGARGGSAPLTHAPGGASMISAPAFRPKPRKPETRFQVMGTDRRNRPTADSVWNEQTGQWERGTVALQNWLGGQKDARAADAYDIRQANAPAPGLEYTARQRAQWDNLNNIYAEAADSGRYTPDELTQIRRQIDARQMGITPLPTLPSKPVDNQKWFQDSTFEKDGILFGKDPASGKPFVLRDAQQDSPVRRMTPSSSDIGNFYRSLMEPIPTDYDKYSGKPIAFRTMDENERKDAMRGFLQTYQDADRTLNPPAPEPAAVQPQPRTPVAPIPPGVQPQPATPAAAAQQANNPAAQWLSKKNNKVRKF